MGDLWPITGDHTGEYALLVAIILAAGHLIGPWIRNSLHTHSTRMISFGGGLAVAYVFLQLVPEIEEAHEVLGDEIHIFILFSFLAFYALELRLLWRHGNQTPDENPATGNAVFWLHIVLSWIYTWMIVFALPGEVTEDLVFAIFGSIAIGLHVIYKGFVLHTHHREAFESRGRYVLAVAPVAGWVAHVVVQPSEIVFDLFIAVLAGFLMQSVFREELPSYDHTRLRWMVAGAIVFLVLALITP